MEMTEQARIRRLQDTLSITGVGVIALTAWSLAKTTMFFMLFDEATQRELYKLSEDIPMEVFYIVFAVLALIDFMIRLYVGLSARAEGNGKRKGFVYLAVAVVLVIASVVYIILVFCGFASFPSEIDLIMTVVFEATSIATLILMIFCAIRLRRLTEFAG